jgi:hypothetical protein
MCSRQRKRGMQADIKTVLQTKSRQSTEMDMDEQNCHAGQTDKHSYSQAGEQVNRQKDALRNLKNNRMLD